MASVAMKDPKHAMFTSGETDPVWIHKLPYTDIPRFSKLDRDLETAVCIVGAGISGISTTYELATRRLNGVLIEGGGRREEEEGSHDIRRCTFGPDGWKHIGPAFGFFGIERSGLGDEKTRGAKAAGIDTSCGYARKIHRIVCNFIL